MKKKMKKKGGKATSRKGQAVTSATREVDCDTSVAARIPVPTAAQRKAAEQKYVEGIVARGEAVPQGTPLPPGATHEIVGHKDDGSPILKRKRFSLK
jgi:hypothetical protein